MTKMDFVSCLVAALAAVAATDCAQSPHSAIDGAARDGAALDGSKTSVTPLASSARPA
jgi:hypothetical protein